MPRRFPFKTADWFRLPLKALVIAVFVFAALSLYPGLTNGGAGDHERAIFGLTVLGGFVISAVVLWVAMDDSYVEVDAETLYVRFEAFFNLQIPIANIAGVETIDPHPHWRYRFGLSTNFEDRIACSHGGQLIELELATPVPARLWPRHIAIRRLWLAVSDHDAFFDELRRVAPDAFPAALAAAA